MTYKEFVSRAMQQDDRNVFSTSNYIPNVVPKSLSEFYKDYNPVNVEINTEYGAIHFYGVDELDSLCKDYYFYPKKAFIFATCNGEPFFVDKEDNKVNTSLEGEYRPEKIADSFITFLVNCV